MLVKNIAAMSGGGEGVLGAQTLLYQPRYKIVWFEEALTARASPHHKQPTCKPIPIDYDRRNGVILESVDATKLIRRSRL